MRFGRIPGQNLELCEESDDKKLWCRAKVVGGAPAWSGFGRVLSGSANDRVEDGEKKRKPFEFLCYRGCRKRLALELEGQSDAQAVQEERVRVMDGTNPRVILRNYIAQNAIEAAENGDFSEVSIGFVAFFLDFFPSFFRVPLSTLAVSPRYIRFHSALQVQRVLKVLEKPYCSQPGLEFPAWVGGSGEAANQGERDEGEEQQQAMASSSTPRNPVSYDSKPPAWAGEICVT